MTLVIPALEKAGLLLKGFLLLYTVLMITAHRLQKRVEIVVLIILCFFYMFLRLQIIAPDDSVQIILFHYLFLLFVTFILSKATISLRLASVGLAVFIYTLVIALSQYACLLIWDHPTDIGISVILLNVIPKARLFSLYFSLLLYSLILFSLQRFFPRYKVIDTPYLLIISMFLMIAEMVISFCYQMFIKHSVYLSQTTTVLVIVLTTICVIFMLALFTYVHSFQQTKQEHQLIVSMNRSMSEGYDRIAENNETLRQMAHDFKHHLLAMQNMDPNEIPGYISVLLDHGSFSIAQKITGDRYVDAIFSSRISRINSLQITFQYTMNVPGTIPLSPSDICTIVSNQLDNAIDACEKISDSGSRWIYYSILLHGDLILFKCENSIADRSLKDGIPKHTTKHDPEHLHGYGIKSLQACADRNGGSLSMQVDNDRFISLVTAVINDQFRQQS